MRTCPSASLNKQNTISSFIVLRAELPRTCLDASTRWYDIKLKLSQQLRHQVSSALPKTIPACLVSRARVSVFACLKSLAVLKSGRPKKNARSLCCSRWLPFKSTHKVAKQSETQASGTPVRRTLAECQPAKHDCGGGPADKASNKLQVLTHLAAPPPCSLLELTWDMLGIISKLLTKFATIGYSCHRRWQNNMSSPLTRESSSQQSIQNLQPSPCQVQGFHHAHPKPLPQRTHIYQAHVCLSAYLSVRVCAHIISWGHPC